MHDIQLRSFLVAADSGSFAKAAKELYVSAPAFTHRINMLESELDFVLFDRSPKGAVLTESGKDFYESALAALATLESSRARCLEKSAGGKQTVRLACPSSGTTPKFYAPLAARFEQLHPEAKLLFASSSWPTMLQDLSRDLFDACFYLPIGDYRSKGLVWKELYRDRYHCSFFPSDPLASRESVALDMLNGREVLCDTSHFLIPELAALYKAAESNGAVLKVMESSTEIDNASLLSLLAGGAVFFSPEQYLASMDSLSTRPLDWPRVYGGILYSENPNPQTRRFIEACETFFLG